MDSAKIVAAFFLFVSYQAAYAQDSMGKYDESEVKEAVEEIGVLDICPNQTLLNLAELDVQNCRNRLARLASVCWHIIDPLVSDYEIEKDQNNKEIAKDRIISLSLVYSSCVRSELLRGIVKKRRASSSG
jgi:hypothetical protein